jgi:hypothetical protein
MSNFQDSRFLGFSGRTLVVTFVIVAVVVGLFFIPETIKFALNSKRSGGAKVASKAVVERRSDPDRAGLSPEALQAISSSVSSSNVAKTSAPAPKRSSESDDGDRPGLFSGWNFRVKAGEPGGSGVQMPSNLSIEKIGSKDFLGLVKRSRGDVKRFLTKNAPKNAELEDITSTFLDQLELASRDSARGMSTNELTDGLVELHVSTIKALAHAGADRGVVMEWLKLPIVAFVDDKVGLHGMEKVRSYFAPPMTLSTVSVRQKRSGGWGADGRSPVTLSAEITVNGSDVDRIVVFNNGRQVAQSAGARSVKEGGKKVRMRGDAAGVWTIVAYDKFGAKPFWKSYSFYPRVNRFPQSRNGEYVIAFAPQSAPRSLDRFFVVGSSRLRQSSDSMISVF